MSSVMFLTIMFVSFIILAILIIPGVFVYRDAKQRGMNAVLWTLVAVLTPSLIGFIIYLLERGRYSNLKCPKCGRSVRREYVACPYCGTQLRPSCPNCFAPIEPDWHICARCAQPLPNRQTGMDVAVPVQKKEQNLSKALLLVFLIPVILPVMAFVGYSDARAPECTSYSTITIDEYLHKNDNEDVRTWINESGTRYNDAYILQYESETDEEMDIGYLIYAPWMTDTGTVSAGLHSNLFGHELKVEVNEAGGNKGNTLILVRYTGKSAPRLSILHNGKRIECEISMTDQRFSL